MGCTRRPFMLSAGLRSHDYLTIADAYWTGSSMRVLGGQHGVHAATICVLLQRLGFPIRDEPVHERTSWRSAAPLCHGQGVSFKESSEARLVGSDCPARCLPATERYRILESMSSLSDVPTEGCDVRCLHPDTVATARTALPRPSEVEQATSFFAMLADPTRARMVLALCAVERLCVCDLAATLGMSESSISHQLRLLRHHRLVAREREGRVAYYRLSDEHVRHVLHDGLKHANERMAMLGVPA